jgi:hypothetical protein
MKDKIVRYTKGKGREIVETSKIQVPDLWHIAMRRRQEERKMILETWQLAHDLLQNHLHDYTIEQEQDEETLTRIGQQLIVVLGLKVKGENGRVDTSWGDKTPLGLAKTIKRIIKGDAL